MLWCRGSGIDSKARGIRAVAWASIPKLLGFGIQLFEKRSFATGRKAIVNQTNAQAQDYDMPRLLAIALTLTQIIQHSPRATGLSVVLLDLPRTVKPSTEAAYVVADCFAI